MCVAVAIIDVSNRLIAYLPYVFITNPSKNHKIAYMYTACYGLVTQTYHLRADNSLVIGNPFRCKGGRI
jgi:hypothetical protein